MNYKSEACSCFVSYPKKFTTKRIILDSYEQIRLLDRIVLKHYFSSEPIYSLSCRPPQVDRF